jgi:8-oxo-dGTP diphosphatase
VAVVAVVGLVDARGWLLMQERDERAPTNPDRWTLLGGMVEAGESPAEAARRELEEETGLVEDHLEPLGSRTMPCSLHGEDDYHLFTGLTTATDGDVDCREGRQIVFVDPTTLTDLDLTDATRVLYPSVVAAHD